MMKLDKTVSESRVSRADAQPKSSSKKRIVVIIIILCLLAVIGALGAVIYSLINEENGGSEAGASGKKNRNTVVTMDNLDQIKADLDNKIGDGMFEVRMNVDWEFKDASTPSENAYVGNTTINSNTVYFDVQLDSTGEVVYESPYIPVGYALENIALNSELDKGTYPCTLVYHLVDDNYEDVSTLAVSITVNVLN